MQNLTKRNTILDNNLFLIIETPLAYIVTLRTTNIEPTSIRNLNYGITLTDTDVSSFLPLATTHRGDGGYGNSDCVCYYHKNGVTIYNQGDIRLPETIIGGRNFYIA